MDQAKKAGDIVYITKVRSRSIADLGKAIPPITMDAHIIEQMPKVWRETKALASMAIIDPVTHFVMYKNAREKVNFKKLPYADCTSMQSLYSDSDYRMERLVKPCVEYQVRGGAGTIVAPYLFATDEFGTAFNTNLTMLSETIRYVREKEYVKPIMAVIFLDKGMLTRISGLNFVVDRYTDEGIADGVDSYTVMFNELDTRKAQEGSLSGYARFVQLLSRDNRTVFTKAIGAFGEVLCAVGASGYISGLGEAETAAVRSLQENIESRGRKKEWVYIPEMMEYAHDTELNKIGYTCKCPACGGGLAGDSASRKMHIFYTRLKEMDLMNKHTSVGRMEQMKNRIARAKRFVDQYASQGSPFKKTHLVNWLSVLESAELWDEAESSDAFEDDLVADLEAHAE